METWTSDQVFSLLHQPHINSASAEKVESNSSSDVHATVAYSHQPQQKDAVWRSDAGGAEQTETRFIQLPDKKSVNKKYKHSRGGEELLHFFL